MLVSSSSGSGSGSSEDENGFFTDFIDSSMELMTATSLITVSTRMCKFIQNHLRNLWGGPPKALASPAPDAMAAEEKVKETLAECSEQTRSGLKSVSTTLDNAEDQLASLRKTIEALDSFESRWKVKRHGL